MTITVHEGRHGLVAHHDEDQVIGRALRLYGEWAEEEVFLLSHALRPGDTVVDVGANVGSHALAFSRMVGEAGRVLAVDGQRRAAEVLTLTVLLNGLRNVTRVEGLAGRETRVVTLDDADSDLANLGGRSFRGALDRGAEAARAPLPAALFTLDSLGLLACRLLKVDVEGMEFDVLQGARATLARLRPVVYFEQTSAANFTEIAALLDELDYDLFWHTANPFNAGNARGEAANIFGGTCEVNVLGVPRGEAVAWPAEVDLAPVRGRDYAPPESRTGAAGWRLPASAYADLPAPARTAAVVLPPPAGLVSAADYDDLRMRFLDLQRDRVKAQEIMDHQAAVIAAAANPAPPVAAPAVLRGARPAETLLIGHSHTQAIVQAFQARSAPVGWGTLNTASGESPVVRTAEGDHLRPDIAAALRRRIGPGTLCVSTIAGNAHNVLAMIAADPPFDFHTPGGLEPVDEAAHLIPYGSVRRSFEATLADGDLSMLRAASAALPEMRVHVESPPPLRDNGLIRARMDRYFVDAHPGAEVADPWLRLKMWRLHSAVTRAACEGLGIAVLPAPAEAADADGFLLPDFADDRSATHANAAYGALVAEQIEALAW